MDLHGFKTNPGFDHRKPCKIETLQLYLSVTFNKPESLQTVGI